jgi:hypothetical protein
MSSSVIGQFMIQDYFTAGGPGPCHEVFPTREAAEAALAGYGSNATITRVEEECEHCGSPMIVGDGALRCTRGCV